MGKLLSQNLAEKGIADASYCGNCKHFEWVGKTNGDCAHHQMLIGALKFCIAYEPTVRGDES